MEQSCLDLQQFVHFADHRQQDATAMQRAHVQQRAQLLVEQIGAHLGQANAAEAQHRVGFDRQR